MFASTSRVIETLYAANAFATSARRTSSTTGLRSIGRLGGRDVVVPGCVNAIDLPTLHPCHASERETVHSWQDEVEYEKRQRLLVFDDAERFAVVDCISNIVTGVHKQLRCCVPQGVIVFDKKYPSHQKFFPPTIPTTRRPYHDRAASATRSVTIVEDFEKGV
jgi:hypothetical protein